MSETTDTPPPLVLAEDADGRVLSLKQDSAAGTPYILAEHPRVGGIAVRVDPAKVMQRLALVVPEPEPKDYDAAVDGQGRLWQYGAMFRNGEGGWVLAPRPSDPSDERASAGLTAELAAAEYDGLTRLYPAPVPEDPRPPEPVGLGAVAFCDEGSVFVRVDAYGKKPWMRSGFDQRWSWVELPNVERVVPGLVPEEVS